MTKLRTILFCLLLALAGVRVEAALFGGEKKAFEEAGNSFRVEMWERAEKELAKFVEDYPKSERLSEVILWQAQAQFQQGKYPAVVDLLTKRQEQAGNFADQYLFWTGRAQFEAKDYPAAAQTFGKLAREFSSSPKRLEAAVNEAASYAKLGDWTNVVELLKRVDGPFRLASLSAPGSEMVARGFLLRAEGQLAQKLLPDAEASLNRISTGLSGELEWRRRFLLCRTLLEWGRADKAVEESALMITAAEGVQPWELWSDSVIFRADLLEQLGRLSEAGATWRRILTNAPVARQRQALLRITALAIQQNQLGEATRTLAEYLDATNAPAADVALLTLGELHLKQHVGSLKSGGKEVGATNHLTEATNYLLQVVKRFPGSAYVGKAQLNLGWCYWVEQQYAESETAFGVAVKRLPLSEDQAVARFKLADAQFAQSNYPAALANYREVLQVLTNWPTVNNALRTPASYQALRASLELTNAAGAEQAMREILKDGVASAEAISSVLLVAQAYVDADQPIEAQRMFGEFALQFPASDLRPEVELLVARLQEEQGEWAKAADAYDAWLGRYSTNRLRAQVEFQRALAAAGVGQETNALQRFTNFVAQFPTNELAPRAQWWVADWYYNQRDYQNAEINFKQLFNTWRKSELAYEARMMAGRAALGRLEFDDAIDHFTSFTSDSNCPVALRVQGLFAYGGALMLWPPAPTSTNKLANVEEARRIFGFVVQLYPTNELVAAAYGEIGNCELNLATKDSAYYNMASNSYRQAMTYPAASVAVRSQAQVGLAAVLEKQAALAGVGAADLLKQGRENCLDVYFGKQLRENETPDLFWQREAGMKAARFSESLNEWRQAIELYRDMLRLKLFPAKAMEIKISIAENQLRPAGEK